MATAEVLHRSEAERPWAPKDPDACARRLSDEDRESTGSSGCLEEPPLAASVFGDEPVLRHLIAAGVVEDREPLRGSKVPVKCATAEEAVSVVRPGDRVFVHSTSCTPTALLWALYRERHTLGLRDVEFIHTLIFGSVPYGEPDFGECFRVCNLFCSPNVRSMVDYDAVDYAPAFMKDCPAMVATGRPASVAFIQVSPPDAEGWVSVGPSPCTAMAAAASARTVVAIVNPQVPRVGGNTLLHMSLIDRYVEIDAPLATIKPAEPSEADLKIGAFVAGMVEDGACLQVGIGAGPEAALAALRGHRDLGVHTEMFSDGLMDLVKRGVINNSRKVIRRGKTVAGFIVGSRALYDFVDRNPGIEGHDMDFVNDPAVIARNPNVIAINGATQVDLTGQVCADSIGHRVVSGAGGQMDFMLGASMSKGGKAIIVIHARTPAGDSRIVPAIATGGGVVTSRPNVGYVVTEYGVARMVGRTLHERAEALVAVAHPDDREGLRAAWAATHKRPAKKEAC